MPTNQIAQVSRRDALAHRIADTKRDCSLNPLFSKLSDATQLGLLSNCSGNEIKALLLSGREDAVAEATQRLEACCPRTPPPQRQQLPPARPSSPAPSSHGRHTSSPPAVFTFLPRSPSSERGTTRVPSGGSDTTRVPSTERTGSERDLLS